MREMLPEAEVMAFVEALQKDPSVSVRVNPGKPYLETGGLAPVAWCPSAFYVDHRPAFILDPLFHAGAYYVQEASSMFVGQALKMVGEVNVALDLCAAPGGKSTLIRSLLPDRALLVSNDPVTQRAQVLAENMIKWGHEGYVVTSNYPKDFGALGAVFDLVVVDAPCSGEGMFRKDNPALELWSEENVVMCAKRQRQILNDVWPSLKEGGYMIYSTCTYNTMENEENVRYICDSLGAEVVEIPVADSWHIAGNMMKGENFPVYRFFPHLTRGEGFFLALLRKTATTASVRMKDKLTLRPLPQEWRERMDDNAMGILEKDAVSYAVRNNDAPVLGCLMKKLRLLTFAIPLYEVKGRKQVPHQALAMSRRCLKEGFPVVSLSLEEALDYLRCMAIKIDAPRGYVLVTYKGAPLGFANNLGNSANNMYPQRWRIRYN